MLGFRRETRRSLALILSFVLAELAAAEERNLKSDYLASVVAQRKGEIADLILKSKYGEARTAHRLLPQTLNEFQVANDPESARDLLTGLVNYSLYMDGGNIPREYIEHDVVVACLVHALHYPEDSIRNLSLKYISRHVRPSRLEEDEDLLISAWAHIKSEKLLLILGSIASPGAKIFLEDLVAAGNDIPVEIRARLGDGDIQRILVSKFQNETDARKKGDLALKLGYIGTDACVLALVGELGTTLVVDQRYYSYSVRYKILRALGMSFPEEALFSVDLNSVVHSTRQGVDSKDAYQSKIDYFNRVEMWCQDRLGVDCDIPTRSVVLSVEKRVPRPLPG